MPTLLAVYIHHKHNVMQEFLIAFSRLQIKESPAVAVHNSCVFMMHIYTSIMPLKAGKIIGLLYLST